MSIYHLSISNISRAVNGNAVASLAYISGDEITDNMTGEKIMYRREDKVLSKKNIVPSDAPQRYKDNAANWCNDIEQLEKSEKARTAKRIRMALPEEMTLAEQQEAVDQWIHDNCTKHGYPATYAIHAGKVSVSESGEQHQNRHVHIIVGNRPLEHGKWATTKNKKVYKLDDYGERIPKLATDKDGNHIPICDEHGAQIIDKHGRPVWQQMVKTGKDGRTRKQWVRETVSQNILDKQSTMANMRKSWANICNRYLAPDKQIDHRSNEARGLSALPTKHEGYKARAIEERGGVADVCEDNRRIKAINEELPKLEAKMANLKYKIMLQRGKLDKLKAKYADIKGSGLADQATGTVMGVAGAIKSAPGKMLDVLGDSNGGFDKALAKTGVDIVKSVVQLNPVGLVKSVMGLPLAAAKSGASEEAKLAMHKEAEKAQTEGILPSDPAEAAEKKKKKKKEKNKGKEENQAQPVRSIGGR